MSNNVEIWSGKKYRYYFGNLNFFSLFLSRLQIKEMFGAGTACVVSPVNRILFEGQVRLDIHIIYVKSTSNLSTTWEGPYAPEAMWYGFMLLGNKTTSMVKELCKTRTQLQQW